MSAGGGADGGRKRKRDAAEASGSCARRLVTFEEGSNIANILADERWGRLHDLYGSHPNDTLTCVLKKDDVSALSVLVAEHRMDMVRGLRSNCGIIHHAVTQGASECLKFLLATLVLHKDTNIPDELRCPITIEIFKDPVVAGDGFTYEENAIRRHIESRLRRGLPVTSPKTNAAMAMGCTVNKDKIIAVTAFRNSFFALDDKRLEDACITAIRRGHVECMRPFRSIQFPRMSRILHAAAAAGHIKLFGVEDESRGTKSRLFVHAMKNRHYDDARFLVHAGADANALCQRKNYTKCSALHTAARTGDVVGARIIVEEMNGDVNIEDGNGAPPLYTAALHRNTAIVSLLLDHGADVNRRESDDDYKRSALYIAVRRRHEDVVHLLIRRGANVNVQCSEECLEGRCKSTTPLGVCMELADERMAKLLWDAGAILYPTYQQRHGYDCDAYLSPIEYAAHCQNLRMIKLCLEWHEIRTQS